MSFLCLWSPAWQTAADSPEPVSFGEHGPLELATSLLAVAPRVSVTRRTDDRGRAAHLLLWADARGMPAHTLAHDVRELLHAHGVSEVSAGVAAVPIAAELAAVRGKRDVTSIEAGRERAYVGVFPVDALEVPLRVRPLLFAIGVRTCAELAVLERDAVEVRLGADALPVWKLARADDARVHTLFAPIPRELPHASLEWSDYEVSDPARLLFMLNALLERVCTALVDDGCGAREITLEFALANRTTHREPLRAARPSANRQTWLRLVRGRLDQMALPAAVVGLTVQVTRIAGRDARQGDLFDRGLASADATAQAIARVIEDQGNVVVVPDNSGHPLLEERTVWREADAVAGAVPVEGAVQGASVNGRDQANAARLTLQLAVIPQAVVVETVPRRDHMVPSRYRDGNGWHEVVNVAGPDRVSGATWNSARAYAREYFRCVTREGALVWLFRDARLRDARRRSAWYLHGWWD
jgi:protein ImuB